jgi:hypothetical protein
MIFAVMLQQRAVRPADPTIVADVGRTTRIGLGTTDDETRGQFGLSEKPGGTLESSFPALSFGQSEKWPEDMAAICPREAKLASKLPSAGQSALTGFECWRWFAIGSR